MSGCATTPVRPSENNAELKKQYRAAIEDAKTAEASEISVELTPVRPYVSKLRRRPAGTRDEPSHVRVATWTAEYGDVAPGDTIRSADVVWVTLVPELQSFCRTSALSGRALNVRLAQVLGLPPDVGYTRFVEMWVRPDDLRRPCPDPEITDRECELSTPRPATAIEVDTSHVRWMETTRAASYGPNGYPWTRLGYTYDWNPNTDEVGTSEYVIRSGATVEIHAVASTAEYCRP
ncbi:hypothetical protein CRI94_03960 [Longibacter salinarum]|uniref:Uncharacterized protein n=1 Tax=Longibacter salinarum TaxID=1850348 RepID=A0A2A8D1H1_9BACT|nr:hypothetical protein [Longibacter salinarum]PEN14653.1 hypothetical protein CRI94_03960 [Longibacter salinarum]